jgi:putative FmdB family regulatory protein
MLTVEFVPTYEYECPKCQRVWEVRQRISEAALQACDRCGGPIHRLLSPAPFILKGGGWYVTDYPSESRKKAMSSSEGGDKAAGEKPSGDKPSGDKPAPGGAAKPAAESQASAPATGGDGASSKNGPGKGGPGGATKD